MVLLHNIFRSAAGTTTERFAASDVLALLKMPDDAVAHALGSFDWGVPIGGIPTFSSTVPRVVQLDEIFAALSRDADGRQPRAAILTGTTGYGKSALAADFCHLHYNAFEFMCWIDCRENDTMMADVRRYTEDLTGTRLGHKTHPTKIFHNARSCAASWPLAAGLRRRPVAAGHRVADPQARPGQGGHHHTKRNILVASGPEYPHPDLQPRRSRQVLCHLRRPYRVNRTPGGA